MNFVMLTHEYPYPAHYGGHVYTSKVIENIHDAGHNLRVISAHPETAELAPAHYHSLFHFFRRRPGQKWRYLSLPLPYMVLRYHTPEAVARLGEAVDALGGQVDAIFVDYLGLGWMFDDIARMCEARRQPMPECIYVSHNVEADVRDLVAKGYKGNPLIRQFLRFDAGRTRRLEESIQRQCGLVTTITEADAERFRDFGIDTEFYVLSPGYKGTFVAEDERRPDLLRRVALIGNRLTIMKKIVLDEFLEHNYLSLSERGIQVEIAGPMKDEDLGRYRERFPSFEFSGFIEDLGPVLASVRLGLIADKVGGGFKHRFLTYVFSRVPIMAPRDSTAGMPLVEWEDYIPFDEPSEIPLLMDRYLDDLDFLDRLQRSAFAKCAEKFSYKANVGAFLEWYAQRTGQVERRVSEALPSGSAAAAGDKSFGTV